MKLLRITLVSLLLCSFVRQASAQAGSLDNAVGLRLGYSPGITFQHFVSDENAFQLILASRYKGWSFTALYEWHYPAFDVDGLQWFAGGGGHLGFYSWYADHPWWDESYTGSRAVIGVDGILGLEYFIGNTPFMVALDWKPAFNLIGFNGFIGDNGALSVRYRF
jgi:hypothetical protein